MLKPIIALLAQHLSDRLPAQPLRGAELLCPSLCDRRYLQGQGT